MAEGHLLWSSGTTTRVYGSRLAIAVVWSSRVEDLTRVAENEDALSIKPYA